MTSFAMSVNNHQCTLKNNWYFRSGWPNYNRILTIYQLSEPFLLQIFQGFKLKKLPKTIAHLHKQYFCVCCLKSAQGKIIYATCFIWAGNDVIRGNWQSRPTHPGIILGEELRLKTCAKALRRVPKKLLNCTPSFIITGIALWCSKLTQTKKKGHFAFFGGGGGHYIFLFYCTRCYVINEWNVQECIAHTYSLMWDWLDIWFFTKWTENTLWWIELRPFVLL